MTEKDLKDYQYQGALLVAESAFEKALLIYNHTGRTEFDLEYGNRLYWFKLDLAAYSKAKDDLEKGQEEGDKYLIAQPHESQPVKGNFTAGHLTSASEFKKQLLHLAPGAMYSGSSAQLERMLLRQLDNIKVVQKVDFVGYRALLHKYILVRGTPNPSRGYATAAV